MIGSPLSHRSTDVRVGITAIGAALPEQQLTTAELQERVFPSPHARPVPPTPVAP
jgi:hypothetical protein